MWWFSKRDGDEMMDAINPVDWGTSVESGLFEFTPEGRRTNRERYLRTYEEREQRAREGEQARRDEELNLQRDARLVAMRRYAAAKYQAMVGEECRKPSEDVASGNV